MSIHRVENQQSFLSPLIKQAPKAASEPVDSSSFSDLLASSDSRSVANPLEPVKTAVATPASAPAPAAPTGFAALFSSYVPAAAASSTSVPFTATFEQGAYVIGPDGSQNNLNPAELATAATAQEVATLLGGTVTSDSVGGGVTTSVPTREITVSGSNVELNAGLVASLFANYGTAPGSQAWVAIKNDLGFVPASAGAVT
jgi:hypothetical protein